MKWKCFPRHGNDFATSLHEYTIHDYFVLISCITIITLKSIYNEWSTNSITNHCLTDYFSSVPS